MAFLWYNARQKAFFVKKDKKFDFFNFLLRNEVRAVPDVPWVHMDDPPDSGVGVIAGMPVSVKILYQLNWRKENEKN